MSTARTTGDRNNVSRFSCAAARIKASDITTVKPATKRRLSTPVGIARPAVRGLAASRRASAHRLKAMAAERAVTMHTTIQKTLRHSGHPAAASIAPARAKGRAKIECSHLIISSVVPTLRSKAMHLVYRAWDFAQPAVLTWPVELRKESLVESVRTEPAADNQSG